MNRMTNEATGKLPTYENFWNAFNEYAKQFGKFQRQGQMFMNVMFEYDRMTYDAIVDRNVDPFHNDANLANAIQVADLYLKD
jgi:hypothetical protein